VESKRTDKRWKPSSPANTVIPATGHIENLDQIGGRKGIGVQLEYGNEGKSLLQIHSQTNTQSPPLT